MSDIPTMTREKSPGKPAAKLLPKITAIDDDGFPDISFISQVANLEPNQAVAKVQLVDPYLTSRQAVERLSQYKQRLMNRINPAVKKVRARTGRQFKLDAGDLIMPKGNWFVVVTVTRTL